MENLTSAAKECCDILIAQMRDRIDSTSHTSSFVLLDPTKFGKFKKDFPTDKLNVICDNYPMLKREKLKNELKAIYINETFHAAKDIAMLYELIIKNNFAETLSETTKFAEINLVTPVSSAESERNFSTLARIKTYLRNRMGQGRLNSLAFLSIHKDVVSLIENFDQKVIDLFASMKDRRSEFLYKYFFFHYVYV